MTAPTPERILEAIRDVKRIRGTVGADSNEDYYLAENVLIEAAASLAAVTAERDQAIENARASQQMHEDARRLLDQTLTERDAGQADNHKIAEMYRIVVKQLADAPHSLGCHSGYNRVSDICNCWKAGL